jgi:hypothetical protein
MGQVWLGWWPFLCRGPVFFAGPAVGDESVTAHWRSGIDGCLVSEASGLRGLACDVNVLGVEVGIRQVIGT